MKYISQALQLYPQGVVGCSTLAQREDLFSLTANYFRPFLLIYRVTNEIKTIRKLFIKLHIISNKSLGTPKESLTLVKQTQTCNRIGPDIFAACQANCTQRPPQTKMA